MEQFRAANAGHLVVMSSVSSRRGCRGAMTTYAASKSFVASLAEGIRSDVLDTPIKVTTVFPGYIESEMTARAKRTPFMVDTETGCRADRRRDRARGDRGHGAELALEAARRGDVGPATAGRASHHVIGHDHPANVTKSSPAGLLGLSVCSTRLAARIRPRGFCPVTRLQAQRGRLAAVVAVGALLLAAGCTDDDASPTPETDTGVSGGDVIASFAAAWPDPRPRTSTASSTSRASPHATSQHTSPSSGSRRRP